MCARLCFLPSPRKPSPFDDREECGVYTRTRDEEVNTRYSRAMGFDVNRFQGDVDEELVCPICSGVLEDPVQVGDARVSHPGEFHPAHFFSDPPCPLNLVSVLVCEKSSSMRRQFEKKQRTYVNKIFQF